MSSALRHLAFAVVTVCILSACEEDKEVKPHIERAEMLMNGRWKLVEAYSNTEKNGERHSYDIFNNLPECEKDNIVKFNGHNLIEEDQGAMKCNPADSQVIIEVHWALVGNSAFEFIHKNLDSASGGHILELSDELLHLRMIGTRPDSTHYEDTYKYEHIQ